jgi:hypothetical protein
VRGGRRAAPARDQREPDRSRAHLTDHAHTINLELGLLVAGGGAPQRVQRHLASLIETGDLAPVADQIDR